MSKPMLGLVLGGAFTVMRFPEADMSDIVYIEQLTGALYLDKREDVERYSEVMERLSVKGTSPDRTPRTPSR